MEWRFTIDNDAIKHFSEKLWNLDAESKFIVDILEELLFNKAMFTQDRSQVDPTLAWNGPFLFTRHRSVYQRQATRERSVMLLLKKQKQLFLPVKHGQSTCWNFQNYAEEG